MKKAFLQDSEEFDFILKIYLPNKLNSSAWNGGVPYSQASESLKEKTTLAQAQVKKWQRKV